MSDKEDLLHDYDLGLEAGYRFVETYTSTENAPCSSHICHRMVSSIAEILLRGVDKLVRQTLSMF